MDFYDDSASSADITLSDIVRYFFAGGILLVVILNSLPFLTSQLYAFGKADAHTSVDDKTKEDEKAEGEVIKQQTFSSNPLKWPVELLTNFRVPHFWFWHFYAISLCVQTFGLVQILGRGRVLQFFLDNFSKESSSKVQEASSHASRGGQSYESVLLVIVGMMMHSYRRLYESLYIQKPGKAMMGPLIYLSGVGFYVMVGFATWCDGMEAIKKEPAMTLSNVGPMSIIGPPRLRTFFAGPLFFMASGCQHDAHAYFASLNKYTLPNPQDHFLFRYVLCPNYTAECLIYLALALLAAPEGVIIGKTWGSIVVFVVLNQAATAVLSKRWYVEKFGREKVAGRAGMIPGIL